MKKFLFCYLLLFTIPLLFAQSQGDSVITVGYTTAPPFIIKNGEQLEGINIWLWKRIANDIGLSYNLKEMEFSTMLSALENGTIDVSINPLTITSQRSAVMEFTHSFYASNSTIAVSEASSFKRILQFVRSFLNNDFLKGLLILLTIITLFGFAGWYFERKANPDQFRTGGKGIWDGLWWSAVTLTTVGYGDKAPTTKMGKMAALALMFIGLLFISGLTASIASSLTVNQLNNDPDSFNEFKERSVGTIGNSGAREFLKKHFFKNILSYQGVQLGLQDLSKGKIEAFIYDEPILKYRIQEDSTLNNLQLLPIKFDVQFYAFGLSKENIELEQAITQRMLEIMETQEWEVLLNEYGLSEL